MLAMVAAVEGAVTARRLDFTQPEALQYRDTAEACRNVGRFEILAYGDSLMKNGVLPRVIREQTGRTAYNLAIVGGQPTTGYYILKRSLEAGARPKTILLGYKASIIKSDPRNLTFLRGLKEVLTPLEAFDLAWHLRDGDVLGSLLVARFVPSYRARVEIRKSVVAALQGESASSRSKNQAFARNWTVNRGCLVNPALPPPKEDVKPELRPAYYPDAWAAEPANVAYIVRFLKLAESRGIEVYWLIPPIRPDVQTHREELGLDQLYVEFMRALQRRFPRLVVVDGRHAGYEIPLFIDPVHLNRRGAPAFTASVAELVARESRKSGGPRWVELPKFRERTGGLAAIEDLDQSKEVMEARGTRLR
jgi:hypothetical protein